MEEDYLDEEDDEICIEDFNVWNKDLEIDPIHGVDSSSKSKFIGLLIFLEDGNPFEYADPYDIYY